MPSSSPEDVDSLYSLFFPFRRHFVYFVELPLPPQFFGLCFHVFPWFQPTQTHLNPLFEVPTPPPGCFEKIHPTGRLNIRSNIRPTWGLFDKQKTKKTAPRGRKVESFPCFLDQWKVWSPLSWKMLRDLTGTGVCISMYQSVSVYVNIYICIFTVLSKSVRMYVYIHENSIVCMIHDFTLLSNNVLAAWRMKRCESKLDNLSSWSWFITRGSVDNLEWWFWLDMNGEICRSSSWYHISCPLPPRQVPHCLPQILPSLPHDARIVRERAASIKRDSRQLYLSTQWSSPTWNLDSSSFKWVNMFYRFKLGPTLERVPFQSKKKNIYI